MSLAVLYSRALTGMDAPQVPPRVPELVRQERELGHLPASRSASTARKAPCKARWALETP